MEQLRVICKEKYPLIIVFIWAFVASFIGNIFVLFATEVVLFAFALVCGAKMQFDIGDILLGLGMFFFYFFVGRSFVMSVVLAGEVLIVYQIGKIIAYNDSCERYSPIVASILGIAFIFWLFAVIDYSIIIINPSNVIDEEWNYLFYSQAIPRTQHEFWFVLSSSIMPVFMFVKNCGKRFRIVGIMMGVLGLLLAILMEGRIVFCIFAINTVMLILFILMKKWSLLNKKALIRISGALLMGVLLVYYLFNKNIFGLKETYLNSMWAGGGGIIKNGRVFLWRQGLDRVINNPFGYRFGEDDWLKSPYSSYETTFAHNSWIDIGLKSGVLPLVMIAIFTLVIIYRIIKILVSNTVEELYFVICAYMGLFLYNFVEPAIMANRVFWFTFIILSGIVTGINNRYNIRTFKGEE